MCINVESTPYFRLLASIGVLGGREEAAVWRAWEHYPGMKEVGSWRAVRAWRPDLVNQSAEKNSLDFKNVTHNMT